MAFDYKKAFKEFYLPPAEPQIADIPEMQFVAVRGQGNPNDEGGEYKAEIRFCTPAGELDYVVPPLEGLWWQEGVCGIDYSRKDDFRWISLIRLPDFVTQEDFDWAKESVQKKKGLDCSRAELFAYTEGTCVQMMHVGSYDDEPATVRRMEEFAAVHGYTADFSETRLHHELYLSDPRKTAPENRRTVIRHPVR